MNKIIEDKLKKIILNKYKNKVSGANIGELLRSDLIIKIDFDKKEFKVSW